MATKDFTLNPKIANAALKNFLCYGFRNASMQMIARDAEVTTGALYTRYKSKDALFFSLVESLLHKFQEKANSLYSSYQKVEETKNVDDFMNAIKMEQNLHLEIFYTHYDECRLID